MKRIRALLFISFFALINNVPAKQTLQVIRGKIIDNESNNYLVGATLALYKDSILFNQSATDNNGGYRMPAIPIGICNLKITYVSYTPVTISKVVVKLLQTNIDQVTIILINKFYSRIYICTKFCLLAELVS